MTGPVRAPLAPGSGISSETRARSAAPRVGIDELHVELPGHSAATARAIVARAVAALAERLPTASRGRFERLELNVRPKGSSEAAIADAIAVALLKALNRT